MSEEYLCAAYFHCFAKKSQESVGSHRPAVTPSIISSMVRIQVANTSDGRDMMTGAVMVYVVNKLWNQTSCLTHSCSEPGLVHRRHLTASVCVRAVYAFITSVRTGFHFRPQRRRFESSWPIRTLPWRRCPMTRDGQRSDRVICRTRRTLRGWHVGEKSTRSSVVSSRFVANDFKLEHTSRMSLNVSF